MFGFSEGIDYSSLTAVLMRIGVVAEVITLITYSPHLVWYPLSGISARNLAYSVVRDGNRQTSFSGMNP
jgi:hypothetical protein